MGQTLLMERVMDETRLAVIEDGALCELYYERPGMENLTGNLYLGRVENVLPGMSAAFIDLGLGKNGFLSAGDIALDVRSNRALAEVLGQRRIEKMVRPGQQLLVQVTKSTTGQKGPRVSAHITLPGRNLVLLPELRYVGVSKKIGDEKTRSRLRALADRLVESGGMGLIVRTAAEHADEAALSGEYARLCGLWRDIQARAEHGVAPRLLHRDTGLALRAARELLGDGVDALWIDGEALYGEVRALCEALAPMWLDRVRLHGSETPLFDLYRVDAQAEKALGKFVWLKNGGSLVIEQTEALTVIDVNTGKYTGKKDQRETLFKANYEAAEEIMRQLRLRDLGGIIVIDFIDMDGEEQRRKLLELMRGLAVRDRCRVNVVDITALGLVELTRKKERQPLDRQLLHTCSDCDGTGRVPSHETTARRAIREIWRRCRGGQTGALLVEACEPVCGWMASIGAPTGAEVYVCPNPGMKAGEYRVSPADTARLPQGTKHLK